MKRYEIYIEDITPCGGPKYARKEFLEAEAESPEEYVKRNGRHPVIDCTVLPGGDVSIRTGDGRGYYVNYMFTELN